MASNQIKYRLGLLVTALLMMFITSAHAERVVQEGAPGLRQKAAVPEFIVKTLIADLGSFELAFVNVDPSGPMGPTLVFEFLPAGEELDSWKRMVSVQVNNVGRTPAEATAVLNAFIPVIQQNFGKMAGDSSPFSEVTQEKDGPALYIEATVGQGSQAEDTIAIWRQVDRMMINVLNQKRGGKLTDEDRQATRRVRSLALNIVSGAKPGQ